MAQNNQNKIKTKIVAFLFNTKTEVLRSEMYQALCLYVLSSAGSSLTIEQIEMMVSEAINQEVELNESLKTIIIEEVKKLVDKEMIILENQRYSINEFEEGTLPNSIEEDHLGKQIQDEIERIALLINPLISKPQIKVLFDFFNSICDLVAKEKMAYIVQGDQLEVNNINFDTISNLVEQEKEKYKIDSILNCETFVKDCFINPTEVLSRYEYVFIQVNLIMQLLAWDPALEYIQNYVLKGKTIYLDSSILFALMLESHEMHDFLYSLLVASKNELGVCLKVQEITLQEYGSVIKNHGIEFNLQQKNIRDIAKSVKKDSENIKDYLDNQIFVDFLINFPDHIDLGSWQRYTNKIGQDALCRKLNDLGINIDKQPAIVPYTEFSLIKQNLLKASMDQVRRGKRSTEKIDVTHDAQIFYLLQKNRRRTSGELSFGYNTYLLTLDGSLVYFAKYQGISWADTYFIFPSQWYELTFPFLRMKIKDNPQFANSYAKFAFSNVFTKLESLLPISLYGYVFDNGGEDLSLRTIKEIIESLIEERLIERLDPSNKNIVEREEAKLNLQRLIAEKVLEEKQIIEKLHREQMDLEAQRQIIGDEVNSRQKELEILDQQSLYKEAEIQSLENKLQGAKNIEDIYTTSVELRKKIIQEHELEVNNLKENYQKNEQEKDKVIEEQKKALDDLNLKFSLILLDLDKQEEQRKEELRKKEKNSKVIKICAIITFGLATLIACSLLLLRIGLSFYGIGAICMLMFIGILLFFIQKYKIIPAIVFGIGLFATMGFLADFYKFSFFLWFIPLIWESLLFLLESSMKSPMTS
jgi:predicted nucleic acid-binding protein